MMSVAAALVCFCYSLYLSRKFNSDTSGGQTSSPCKEEKRDVND